VGVEAAVPVVELDVDPTPGSSGFEDPGIETRFPLTKARRPSWRSMYNHPARCPRTRTGVFLRRVVTIRQLVPGPVRMFTRKKLITPVNPVWFRGSRGVTTPEVELRFFSTVTVLPAKGFGTTVLSCPSIDTGLPPSPAKTIVGSSVIASNPRNRRLRFIPGSFDRLNAGSFCNLPPATSGDHL